MPSTKDVLRALRRLKVETGSLACFGCGLEHNCGIHGCAILRDAIALIEELTENRSSIMMPKEVLTNTLTGETSVGWWRGGVEDRPGMEGEA